MISIIRVAAAVGTRVGKLNSRLVQVVKPADLEVIFILWFPELLDPWLITWNEKFIDSLFGGELQTSAYFKMNMALVFIFKCSLCIALSLSADVHDREYHAFLICSFIYFITPVVGLFIYTFQVTNSVMLISLGLSFMFICRPVRLCSTFAQIPYPSSNCSRLLSSLFIFTYCVSTYVALTTFVNPYPHFIMILSTWSVVILGFLVVIPISFYLRQFVRRREVEEHTIGRILIGMREDIKSDIENGNLTCCRAPKNSVKATIFLLLLIPILLSSVIHLYVYQIDGNNRGPNLSYETTETVFIWQIMAIPVGGVILLLISKISDNTAEVLSLGLPYLLNLAAVVLIFFEFNFKQAQVEELNSLVDERTHMREFVGPLPARRSEIYEFYNLFDRTIRVYANGEDFLIKAGERSTYTIVNKLYIFDLVVTTDGGNFNDTRIEATGGVDEIRNYIIKGNVSSHTLQVSEVSGSEWVRPVRSPILVFMNTFVKINDTKHRIEVEDGNSSEVSGIMATDSSKSSILHVSASSLNISYYTLDEYGRHTRLFEAFETQPYSVYTLIIDTHSIDHGNVSYRLRSFLIMQLIDDEDVTKPEPTKHHTYVQDIPLVLTAFRLHGAALGLIQVGFIHHFWTQAPTRLKATVLATVLVADLVIDRLLKPHLGHFDRFESYFILILQIFCTLWHLVFAGIYYYCLEERHKRGPSPSGVLKKHDHSIAFTDDTVIPNMRESEEIPEENITPRPVRPSTISNDLGTKGRMSYDTPKGTIVTKELISESDQKRPEEQQIADNPSSLPEPMATNKAKSNMKRSRKSQSEDLRGSIAVEEPLPRESYQESEHKGPDEQQIAGNPSPSLESKTSNEAKKSKKSTNKNPKGSIVTEESPESEYNVPEELQIAGNPSPPPESKTSNEAKKSKKSTNKNPKESIVTEESPESEYNVPEELQIAGNPSPLRGSKSSNEAKRARKSPKKNPKGSIATKEPSESGHKGPEEQQIAGNPSPPRGSKTSYEAKRTRKSPKKNSRGSIATKEPSESGHKGPEEQQIAGNPSPSRDSKTSNEAKRTRKSPKKNSKGSIATKEPSESGHKGPEEQQIAGNPSPPSQSKTSNKAKNNRKKSR
ncbi:hypothetical protein GE061_006541 [Apolygus lucorum]|uniref:Uncharacterized protein n=1 Tax=Apolygus lucorum TaxID=248454 RepID=A0A6A4IVS2_APOLU|nr:hypothetical protein GE061_006541 [Apolygus lucorum]